MSLNLIKPDFNKFNSKLLKEEEIKQFLFQVYKQEVEDSHDDRTELSSQIESKEENQAIFDVMETNVEVNDLSKMQNQDIEKMDEESISAMEEVNNDDQNEDGEDEIMFDM